MEIQQTPEDKLFTYQKMCFTKTVNFIAESQYVSANESCSKPSRTICVYQQIATTSTPQQTTTYQFWTTPSVDQILNQLGLNVSVFLHFRG